MAGWIVLLMDGWASEWMDRWDDGLVDRWVYSRTMDDLTDQIPDGHVMYKVIYRRLSKNENERTDCFIYQCIKHILFTIIWVRHNG